MYKENIWHARKKSSWNLLDETRSRETFDVQGRARREIYLKTAKNNNNVLCSAELDLRVARAVFNPG